MSEDKAPKGDVPERTKPLKAGGKAEAVSVAEVSGEKKVEAKGPVKQDSAGDSVLPQSIETVLADLTAVADVKNTSTTQEWTFSFLPPHGRRLPPSPAVGMQIRVAELLAHVTKRKRRWKAFLSALQNNRITISTPT